MNLMPFRIHSAAASFSAGRADGACSFTAAAASAIADQMLEYTRITFKGQHDAAIDVLMSGISMGEEQVTAQAKARLWCEISWLEAGRSKWGRSEAAAQSALKSVADSATAGVDWPLAVRAEHALVKAQLLQGQGKEAVQQLESQIARHSANQAVELSPASLQLKMLRQLALQAQGEWTEPAPELQLQGLQTNLEASGSSSEASVEPASTSYTSTSSDANVSPLATALSLKVLGDWHFAKGYPSQLETAGSYFKTAAAVAGQETSSSASTSSQDDAGPLLEVRSDALLGQAQVHAAQKQWEAAEELLGTSLEAAEGVGGDRHPRLAPVLLALARIYARSARITLAEGLFRETGKLLHLDPVKLALPTADSLSVSSRLAHPSLSAAVGWSYAQLLSALPNRGAEAQAWSKLADHQWGQWHECGARAKQLDAVFGDLQSLKGSGNKGSGALLSLQLRAAVPL